jgi:ferrous iron transport protein B
MRLSLRRRFARAAGAASRGEESRPRAAGRARRGLSFAPHEGFAAEVSVALVGPPNVGKSSLFNALTGSYVTVSNYPGTTVGVSRGRMRLRDRDVVVFDTPGLYSLLPLTDDERVVRYLLANERPSVVLHVVDAKNLERHLPLTLQLREAGFRVVLVLNLADEAQRAGIEIDEAALARRLGLPVVSTVATRGRGIEELLAALGRRLDEESPPTPAMPLPEPIESAVRRIESRLAERYPISNRTLALLLLEGDEEVRSALAEREGPAFEHLEAEVESARGGFAEPVPYRVAIAQRDRARALLDGALRRPAASSRPRTRLLERLCEHPLTGIPILIAVLYFGLYQVVGVFGAGDVVAFLEGTVFGRWVNPAVTSFFERVVPWEPARALFVGEYGIVTLGLTYAIALVLPVVGLFFLLLALLEDTGYLPRLALLVDRLFKTIGLNGRAEIPIVLGFGCDTMATIVTRIQETKRERLLTTLLLALAIPCSAQLGLFLGLLAADPNPALFWLWAGIVAAVFFVVGAGASRLLPGESATFHMELPPFRWPRAGNVLAKTASRMHWYFREVFPLFVWASVLLWIGHQVSLGGRTLFAWTIEGITPAVRLLGLPDRAAQTMLFGFFRRDYAAADLFAAQGGPEGLTSLQLLVAAVVLTLFIPCVAQFLVMKKEHGWRRTLACSAFIFGTAFAVGWIVKTFFAATGWIA